MARKISSCLVVQLSTRIVSPGRKVSASTSHTVPRWVPILERENRSSYFQARLSNAVSVWSLAAGVAVRFDRILLFEDLRHELRLNLIQLLQSCLQCLPVFVRSFVADVLEAKRRAPH